MVIIKEVANMLGKSIMGGVEFSAMKQLVKDIENEDLTGADKRELVLKDFEAIGYQLAGWVIDTGLQLALLYLRGLA